MSLSIHPNSIPNNTPYSLVWNPGSDLLQKLSGLRGEYGLKFFYNSSILFYKLIFVTLLSSTESITSPGLISFLTLWSLLFYNS